MDNNKFTYLKKIQHKIMDFIIHKNYEVVMLVLNKINNNPLWKGAFIIGSGTAIGQIITFITTPLITRLYSPADFGIFGIFTSILAILTVIASLRYEFALPIPKNSHRAANLFILCILIMIIITITLSGCLFFIGEQIFSIFNYQSLTPFYWLIIIGFIGSGFYQMLNYWSIRQRDYQRITNTKISQSIGGSLSKILFGIAGLGPIGLLIGYILSNALGIWTLAKALLERDRSQFTAISIYEITSVAKEYREFPYFTTPATLINAFSLQLPIFMLTFMYNTNVVGWFSLAYSLVMIPIGLVGNSLGQVFLGEAAKNVRENPNSLKSLQQDTTKKLVLISIPLIGFPVLLAPWLIPIIFGNRWAEAGLYCLPLALVAISNFIVSPTNKLTLYGFNKWNFLWNILRAALVILGFYLAVVLNVSPIITLTIYGIITLILQGILLALNFRAIDFLIKKYDRQNI